VVEYAYVDIIQLRSLVTLGLLREIHRWGAHAMIIAIWLHMLRVFLTGSYKPPREFNWGVGVVLLVLTLLLSFTGYLLPWDQLAMWAITVGSNMARATPLAGHEGPLASLLTVGGVPLVHAGSDARFGLLGGTVGRAERSAPFLCVALHLPAVGGGGSDGRALLENTQGRGDLRTALGASGDAARAHGMPRAQQTR